METIKVASRGSRLALTQSQQVIDNLTELNAKQNRQLKFEIVEVKTHGDRGDLSVMGAFTNAIEQALVDKKADMAIHSYKDLPTEINQYLSIAAIPTRADARDVMISEKYSGLQQIPDGSIIGTGSPRRKAQLKAINSTWDIKFINGNIDTRIKKLKAKQYDAIILAAAGLVRMGWQDQVTEYLLVETMIPAPAQGALAIQCRKNDERIVEVCQPIHCKQTALAVAIERKILSGIGGGCQLPIGAYVQIEQNHFILDALFGTLPDKKLNAINIKHPLSEIEMKSAEAIEQLIKHSNTQIPNAQ